MRRLYFVASALPCSLTESQRDTLRNAGHKRAHRRAIYVLAGVGALVVVAALTAILYTRQFARFDLPLEAGAYATARDAVYFSMTGIILAAVSFWGDHRITHGARHARSSVLWLRRFHVNDSAQQFFNNHLAKVTPATFAVTLRDSKVTGNRTEGMRRATPVTLGILLICFAAIAMWQPLYEWCAVSETRCAIVDRIWFDPDVENGWWYAAHRSFSIAFVLTMMALCAVLLLWVVVYMLAPRFGDTRGDTIDRVKAWYEGRAKGSPNRTYVLRTSDSDWRRVVSYLHDRSCLTVFDLTAPSKHLDYELSLARGGGQYAFICKASRGAPFADTEAFVEFLRQRVSPDVVALLRIECLERSVALRRLAALTEAALPA